MDKLTKKIKNLQQQELNAVAMYKYLAGRHKNEEVKAELLKIAADEGKHAAACKAVTGIVLKPKKLMVNMAKIGLLLGWKGLFSFIPKFENLGMKLYFKIADDFADAKWIGEDEVRHGKLIKTLKSKKNKPSPAQPQ